MLLKMKGFFEALLLRNEVLFWFGATCFGLGALFLVLARVQQLEFAGANAWFKPVKFALSIGIYAWTMILLADQLKSFTSVPLFSWAVVILFGFELIYIAWQASRGQASHFNVSTPAYAGLYQLMAVAAAVVTLWTAYFGVLFFVNDFPELSPAMLWAIRLGIILFVVFSLEGFVMGSRLAHNVGGPDGSPGIPFLGWSFTLGDLRVAHFIGMHALQVLPLLALAGIRQPWVIALLALAYGLLAAWTLAMALQGVPVIHFSNR